MSAFQAENWTVRRGLFLAGGTALCAACLCTQVPIWICWTLAAISLAAGILLRLRRPTLLFCLAIFAVFCARTSIFRLQADEVINTNEGSKVSITAQVINASGQWYTVKVTEEGDLPQGTNLLLHVSDTAAPQKYEQFTALVRVGALTSPSFWADRIFLRAYPVIYEEEALVHHSVSVPKQDCLYPLRRRLIEAARSVFSREESGMLIALCLGDRSYLSAELTEIFRRCGLPHLLVVSGLHLSIITGAFYALCRALRFSLRLTALLTMMTTGAFMLLVGFSPSVIRAGVMTLVLLAGQLSRRRGDGLNSLGLAALILVSDNPYVLYDLSFVLSFAATAGILALSPTLHRWLQPNNPSNRIWRYITGNLSITLGASLPLLPVLAYHFGTISLLSPLANLIAAVPAACILTLALPGMLLLPIPGFAALGKGLIYIAAVLARGLLRIASLLSRLPGASVSITSPLLLCWLTLSCIGIIIAIGKRRRNWLRRVLAIAAAMLVLFTSIQSLWQRNRLCITLLSGQNSACILLECEGKTALLAQTVNGLYLADVSSAPDFILIGGGETSQASQVSSLLHGEKLPKLLLSGNDAWARGLFPDAERLTTGSSLRFWNDGVLFILPGGWWKLTWRNSNLLIAADGTDTLPADVDISSIDGVVFYQTIVYNKNWNGVTLWLLAPNTDQEYENLPPNVAVVSTHSRLTTRGGGEWRWTQWN